VGTYIEAAHTAATAVGATITATATLVESDGRKLKFEITAYEADTDGDKQIGKATHERIIVDEEKFMGKLFSNR
jgi:predicted thioesterase